MPNRIRGTRPARAALATALGFFVACASFLPVSMLLAPRALGAGECVDGWRRVAVPTGLQAFEPFGATSLDGGPAWLVGGPNATTPQRPLILRWQADHWTSVPAPWARYGSLLAVSAQSPTAAWAVGNLGRPVGHAILTRWDGSAWRKVRVPALKGTMSTLADVEWLDAKQAWVVGSRLLKGQVLPVAMVRKAKGWKKWMPKIGPNQEAGLTSVTRAPGGRVWTGGWRSDDGLQAPWLMYRDGNAWREVVPAAVNGPAAITGMAFAAADDGWIVGYVENAGGGGYMPLLQHWNGVAWSNVESPWVVGDSVMLNSVAIDGAGRVTVAGQVLKNGERRAALAVLAGGTWHVRSVPGTHNPASSFLTTASGHAGGGFVAGNIEGLAGVLETCAADDPAPGVADAPPAPGVSIETDEEQVAPAPPKATVSTTQIPGLVARDRTAAAGLTMTTDTFGGLVDDFNGDGHDDILINFHVGYMTMMMGSAEGRFSALDAPWLWADRHGCAAADVNADDQLDLYCTIGASRGRRATGSELLLQPGSGAPLNVTSDYGIFNAWARGRDATFFNLDGDEFPDLYVTAEPERMDALQSANRLYRNVGGEYFDPVPSWRLNRSMGGNCATAADIDADGDDDLFVCVTKAVDGQAKGARLYINENGTLVDRTSAWGIVPTFDDDIEIADFDGDGQLDVAQLNEKQVRVSLRQGNKFKISFTYATKRAVAMAIGDVNDDARPDIYISQRTVGNSAHVMLVNNGGGGSFKSIAIPQASGGSAEDVLAIDYDGNGLTDFVTLNGRYSAGPIMLIAFFME